MIRRILLFLASFLLTVGVFAALWMGYAAYRITNKPEAKPAATEQATPADETAPTTPAVTDTTPADDEVTTPAVEPAPVDEAVDAVTPAPAPSPLPALAEQPRSPEHAAALQVEAALRAENPEESLRHLTETGKLSPETAQALLDWGKQHKPAGVENVGTARRADGSKVSRWRVISADGGEDMILEIVTDRQGNVTVESAKAAPSDKTQLAATSDSLAVAEGFVEAVRRGDMAKARGMVAGAEVSDATVAGLCMIFEEGAFALRQDAPIRNTFENAEHAGFLVYLVGSENDKPSNIGLGLTNGEQWKVTEVALDSLLSSYEESGNAEGGRFFPIVKNPKGGDSLALFFGFNESVLTPRSMRQLQIVAELLKQSRGMLNISGHTDDVGSDQYNMALSEKRAQAVRDALVSFGVQPEQITTHGLGKSQPRRMYKEGDTDKQIDYIRGENRRAEIYLDFES